MLQLDSNNRSEAIQNAGVVVGAIASMDDIRSALAVLDSGLARGEWAKIGMALKSELGDDGFSLFDEWSQNGHNYDKAGVRSTWRSIKATGSGASVTIAHLFAEAKKAGWSPVRRELTPEMQRAQVAEQARRALARQALEQAELARDARFAEQWRALFGRIWLAHMGGLGPSPYLGKKGVSAFGLGFPREPVLVVLDEDAETVREFVGWPLISPMLKDKRYEDKDRFSVRLLKRGLFLVPMRGRDGVIQNAQIIYPTGKKSFPRHAPKTGLFHLLGNPPAPGEWLALCEGYATAASIHMAVGWPVACAFDVGNLRPVAMLLRELYPQARLMICGDDDRETPGNPGRTTATAVARELGCKVVFPDFSGA